MVSHLWLCGMVCGWISGPANHSLRFLWFVFLLLSKMPRRSAIIGVFKKAYAFLIILSWGFKNCSVLGGMIDFSCFWTWVNDNTFFEFLVLHSVEVVRNCITRRCVIHRAAHWGRSFRLNVHSIDSVACVWCTFDHYLGCYENYTISPLGGGLGGLGFN